MTKEPETKIFKALEAKSGQKASDITSELGRLIQPGGIADMAIFLCSKRAKMITGQTYHINGGTYSPG